MGDVISTHLDEGRRHYISECTKKVLRDFSKFYEEQYGVALFNNVRYEIEGNGGPQSQLLHRKGPQDERIIFSGNIFQYLEDNKKWRNRFCLVPHYYGVVLYENKIACDRGLQPRAGLNCAGYKVLKSMDAYMELVSSNSLPGGKAKSGGFQMKCATQFPIILWHPYGRHYYFCVMTEKEQEKWAAVFQDCVRHCNDGIPEDSKVEAPAFTDAVRLYRQSKDQYGTWELLCGNEVQVLSNLVMEELVPELKNMIGPKLKGKPYERQRIWMLILDTVYRMVQDHAKAHHRASAQRCEAARPAQEASIRTDMDQIITSKEHLASKIRASVLPKAEICVRNHIQPYIPSILEALMLPTSQGFSEVRDLFFKEVTEMNMNVVNEGGTEKLGEHMEKLSQLAFHPVKMQVCYEAMEQLKLEGLQQRFDVSSTSVFKQRAQIHMREQMDNAVFTFEQLLHQELEKTTDKDEVCKTMQRILERVLKKYDYDSSTVRKRFFREALLQIIMPFLLKKLAPTCKADLPRFQELIFEDFARSILVENTYEEVVLQSVIKEIMLAVKEAAVQRKHNLYRDSIVLHNSDPNLHLLGEGPPIDWSEEYGGNGEEESENAAPIEKPRRQRQVVSVVHDDENPLQYESCAEVPAHEGIQEEPEAEQAESEQAHAAPEPLQSPDYVKGIRSMLVKEFDVETPIQAADQPDALLKNNNKVEEREQSERPTSEAPTSEAPTSEAPTSEASTSEAPASEAPASDAPASEAPTSEAPTSEAPTSEAPTQEEPTREAPVHKEPTYETTTHPEPSCETSTQEEPMFEADAHKESARDSPTERETLSQEVSPEEQTQVPFREQEPTHEATDEKTVNEEPSHLYVPHSVQHDSGFQSPSNEGENVEEKSVMPDSPVKPSLGAAVISSDLEIHRGDNQSHNGQMSKDTSTTVQAMLEKADHVHALKETLGSEEGLTKF